VCYQLAEGHTETKQIADAKTAPAILTQHF